jgi:hypothetical protein
LISFKATGFGAEDVSRNAAQPMASASIAMIDSAAEHVRDNTCILLSDTDPS